MSSWWRPFKNSRVFLGFDYNQLEIRFLAQVSKDKRLAQLFNTKEDIHSTVGHEITGWPVKVIKEDDQKRKLVKNLHFGMIYGLDDEGMYRFVIAKGVRTTQREITRFRGAYFVKFPGVEEYIDWCHAYTRKHKQAVTIFGFPIPIDVRDDRGKHWMNEAVNYTIQGGAHFLMLIAFALLHRAMQKYKLLIPPSLEIHDADYFTPQLSDLRAAYDIGRELLERDVLEVVRREFGIKWVIPLEVEAKAGFRFGTMTKYRGEPPAEFLDNWCWLNRQRQLRLHKEMAEVERAEPAKSLV